MCVYVFPCFALLFNRIFVYFYFFLLIFFSFDKKNLLQKFEMGDGTCTSDFLFEWGFLLLLVGFTFILHPLYAVCVCVHSINCVFSFRPKCEMEVCVRAYTAETMQLHWIYYSDLISFACSILTARFVSVPNSIYIHIINRLFSLSFL